MHHIHALNENKPAFLKHQKFVVVIVDFYSEKNNSLTKNVACCT